MKTLEMFLEGKQARKRADRKAERELKAAESKRAKEEVAIQADEKEDSASSKCCWKRSQGSRKSHQRRWHSRDN